MLLKLREFLLALTLLLASPLAGHAVQPFDTKSFQEAQAAGKTILLDVAASWCSTCRQQHVILQDVEKEKPELVVYEVDYDKAKNVLKRFRVQYQSTLIVFKGSAEVGRSTGETDPARIRALVAKGL